MKLILRLICGCGVTNSTKLGFQHPRGLVVGKKHEEVAVEAAGRPCWLPVPQRLTGGRRLGRPPQEWALSSRWAGGACRLGGAGAPTSAGRFEVWTCGSVRGRAPRGREGLLSNRRPHPQPFWPKRPEIVEGEKFRLLPSAAPVGRLQPQLFR